MQVRKVCLLTNWAVLVPVVAFVLMLSTPVPALATPVGYHFTAQDIVDALTPDAFIAIGDGCGTESDALLHNCGILAVAVTPHDSGYTVLSGISPIPSGANAWGVGRDHFDVDTLADRVFVEYHDLHEGPMAPLDGWSGDVGFPGCGAGNCTQISLLTLYSGIEGEPLMPDGFAETGAAALPLDTTFKFYVDVPGTVSHYMPVYVEFQFMKLGWTVGTDGVRRMVDDKPYWSVPIQLDAEVPEPASAGLFAVGLSAAFLLRRRATR